MGFSIDPYGRMAYLPFLLLNSIIFRVEVYTIWIGVVLPRTITLK